MKRPLIIAECAVEHLGSLEVAKQMAYVSKKIGVDIVKYQLHLPSEEMLPNKIKFWGGSLDSILKKYNLSISDHYELFSYCKKIGIEYLCTPFSPKAVDILNEIGVKRFKTGSGEMMNFPLIDRIIKTKKPLIMSTGMASLDEIDLAIKYFLQKSKRNNLLTITNCTSIYPCPNNKVNLGLIKTYKDKYKIPVGHSDHTPDIYSSLGAVALGASVIEKHFTLNKELRGPDYAVSIEPDEMKNLVIGAKKIFLSSGNKKTIHNAEKLTRNWAYHSIVSKKNIKKGDILSRSNVTIKRPGGGVPAREYNNIIGKKYMSNLKKNEQLKKKYIKLSL